MPQGDIDDFGRVVFGYELQNSGSKSAEIPFTIAVIANLSAEKRPGSRSFHNISHMTIDEVIKKWRPSLKLIITNDRLGEIEPSTISLEFTSLSDFHPSTLVQRLASLRPANEPELLKDLLNAILHDPSFERLHSTWLGLERVHKTCCSTPSAELVIFNITQEELTSDTLNSEGKQFLVPQELTDALERLSSNIFGGHPPAALILDFEFGYKDLDVPIDVLSSLAKLAAETSTVLIGSASRSFLPQDFFAHINAPLALHHQEINDFDAWRQFRRQPWAQSTFLTLPPVLLRLPYQNVPLFPQVSDSTPISYYDESVFPEYLSPSNSPRHNSGFPMGERRLCGRQPINSLVCSPWLGCGNMSA